MRLNRQTFALAAAPLLLWGAAASAHDFWLQPTSFTVQPGQSFELSTRVGHADDQSHWPLAPKRLIGLRSVGPNGMTDHQARAAAMTEPGEIRLALTAPGTHIVFLEGTHAESTLEAERFNSYVEEEGVLPIGQHRRSTDTMDQPGHEIYSRRGKAIIQVGPFDPQRGADVTRALGLTLEITPLAHPLSLAPGKPLEFEVRYRGLPVAGATVHRARLDRPDIEVPTLTADAAGRISMARPEAGDWMLHVVWSAPTEGAAAAGSEADYDTVFSSLTFGF